MTASERAAEVLRKARNQWMRDCASSGVGSPQYTPPSHVQVAALMADPDLLVDLAIEAGGLEPDEPMMDAHQWWRYFRAMGPRHPDRRTQPGAPR